MSDIHLIDGDNTDWTLVFHFPVPDVNNDVNVNYRTALINSELGLGDDGRRTRLPSGTSAGQITPAEEALLDAGELFEQSVSFPIESGGTAPSELIVTAEWLYSSSRTSKTQQLQAMLRYFGFTHDLP